MSGLLDKATKSKETSVTKEESSEPARRESDAILTESTTPFDNGLNLTNMKFQAIAVIGFIITMILVFFIDNIVLFGGITLDDFLVPGILIWWVVFNGNSLKDKEFDTTKLVVSGVAFLVVTVAFFGIAIFNSTDSGVTIGNIEYDGEEDEIDLSFYGPKGMDYTVEVLVDGKVEYSHDDTISIEKGSHSISLDDFWKGNAEDMKGDTLVEYEIRVTSDGDESSMTFDDIMNREVDTAFIKITEVLSTNTEDKTYTGITVEMFVGMGNPGSSYDFSNNYFTGTTPKPIASDWSAVIAVKFDSTTKYTYDSIEADEGVANGIGEFTRNWVVLPGTESGDLARDDFYQAGDGCYTFEVTLENEHGEILVDTSSKIEFYWDSNEADPNSEDDQPAEAC
tara:strand:- start:282 stop:1466 length:1185 start_codon:yes stop_codon:yes gene_type:complete